VHHRAHSQRAQPRHGRRLEVLQRHRRARHRLDGELPVLLHVAVVVRAQHRREVVVVDPQRRALRQPVRAEQQSDAVRASRRDAQPPHLVAAGQHRPRARILRAQVHRQRRAEAERHVLAGLRVLGQVGAHVHRLHRHRRRRREQRPHVRRAPQARRRAAPLQLRGHRPDEQGHGHHGADGEAARRQHAHGETPGSDSRRTSSGRGAGSGRILDSATVPGSPWPPSSAPS
jgi:hypothetical protein